MNFFDKGTVEGYGIYNKTLLKRPREANLGAFLIIFVAISVARFLKNVGYNL